MADRIPAGAFPEAAAVEQQLSKLTLGTERPSFNSRSRALTEMRKAINEYEIRITKLEEVLSSRPF